MSALEAWMALAWRSGLPDAERWERAKGMGPGEGEFAEEVLERERADLRALERIGVRLVRAIDPEFPERWRAPPAPVLLQVAGNAALLGAPGVEFVAGARGSEGARLADLLDRGGRACVLLSKGLLSARGELRALAEPIADGSLALVSAEPPRASWGPARERRRAALLALLRG